MDQTIRNLTYGDLGITLVVIRLGVTRLEKARVTYLLDLFEGRWEKEQRLWLSACGDHCGGHWANGDYVNVLPMCGECGLGSLRSWSYSKEWVWNLGTKSVLNWNVSKMKFQEFNLNKGIFNFFSAKIWVPLPVYRYENCSRYITDI